MAEKQALESGETLNEMHMVEKEASGARIEKYRGQNNSIGGKITQLFGDSAKFDFSPYYNSFSLVFVDGSHAFEYTLSDTKEAIKIVRKGGVIIWHYYGLWKGVTRALEEIERKDNMGLRNIAGTSLVYWRKS